MAKALPAELKEVVKSMFLAGVKSEVITEETGVSRRLIAKWACKGQWAHTVATAKEKMVSRGKASLARQAANDIAASSANVRSSLASVLVKQAAALDKVNPKADDLANTRTRQGQAAVAETLSKTAERVFGWGEEQAPGLVLAVNLSMEAPGKATTGSVIDIESAAESPKSLQDSAGQLNTPDIVRNLPESPGNPDPGAEQAPPPSPGPTSPA